MWPDSRPSGSACTDREPSTCLPHLDVENCSSSTMVFSFLVHAVSFWNTNFWFWFQCHGSRELKPLAGIMWKNFFGSIHFSMKCFFVRSFSIESIIWDNDVVWLSHIAFSKVNRDPLHQNTALNLSDVSYCSTFARGGPQQFFWQSQITGYKLTLSCFMMGKVAERLLHVGVFFEKHPFSHNHGKIIMFHVVSFASMTFATKLADQSFGLTVFLTVKKFATALHWMIWT